MEADIFFVMAFFVSFLDGGLISDCRYYQQAQASYQAKRHLSQCCLDFQCYQVEFNSLNNSAVYHNSEVSVSDPNAISFWKKSQHVLFQPPINFLTSAYRVPIPGGRFGVGLKVSAVVHPVSGFELGRFGIALESSYDRNILIYADVRRKNGADLSQFVLSCRWGTATWATSNPYEQMFPNCVYFQPGDRVEISFIRTQTASVLVTIDGLMCNRTEFNYSYSQSIDPAFITHVLLENYGELHEITISL